MRGGTVHAVAPDVLATYFDEAWYRAHNPSVPAGPAAFEHYRSEGAARNLTAHPLFSPNWYLRRYSEAGAEPGGAIAHYINVGAALRLHPHPAFQSEYYAAGAAVAAGDDPLAHYIRHGRENGVDPHPLFSTSFYLASRRFVRIAPLADYLMLTERRTYSPHPLFDEDYYVENNYDVMLANLHPFTHFLEYGAFEQRDPHARFSCEYYLDRYPDVQDSGMNPLIHYVLFGFRELRRPHPFFNAAFYAERYLGGRSDVNPLLHYVTEGAAAGALGSPLSEVESALPSDARFPRAAAGAIDVIIPVYRDYDATRECVESVLASDLPPETRIIAIDDDSPEPLVSEYLRSIRDPRFLALRNALNRGFVGTVNRGMAYGAHRDVVLLNSDTVVANDWLTRLRDVAYSADDIASVTPLSNNATICSFPVFCEDNAIDEERTAAIDGGAAAVNAGRAYDVPTAVGFCMYIRRDALDAVGLFDEETFGKGYGEENDFCMRALAQGRRHVLATNVFVYHAGEVSFAESAKPSKQTAMKTLARLHPNYGELVRRHVELDPAEMARLTLAAALFGRDAKPTLLYVGHALGGGTEKHIVELSKHVRDRYNVLLLTPVRAFKGVLLETLAGPVQLSVDLDPVEHEVTLLALLRLAAVQRVHVHHLIGYGFDLERLISLAGVPFDFTVHDYYAICPQINLTDRSGVYCGEPEADGCNRCLWDRPVFPFLDIDAWREKNRWLVRDAARVIAPSHDVATRMARYFPDVTIDVVPHP